jgi:hypothetical protein
MPLGVAIDNSLIYSKEPVCLNGDTAALSYERSGGGNCEAISDGAVASSKVFDYHIYSEYYF